jgi:hypothetical protein
MSTGDDLSSYCFDPEAREKLRQLLAGETLHLGEGTIPNARTHWRSCSSCKAEFPHANNQFAELTTELWNDIRSKVERLRHLYISQRHSGLANEQVASVSPYATIIAGLLQAGEDVQYELGFVTEYGGIADFWIHFDHDDAEAAGANRNAAVFIRSCSSEVQEFIFASILAKELLSTPYALAAEIDDSDTIATTSYIDAYLDIRLRRERKIADWLSKSGLSLRVFDECIATSAKKLLREYLRRDAAAPNPFSSRVTVDPAATAAIDDLRRDFRDFEDSMKAGQMEILRVFDRNRGRAEEAEAMLRNALGENLYTTLDDVTRRALQLGEYFMAINSETDGFSAAIVYFSKAFENELKVKLVDPLVAKFLKRGILFYDGNGNCKSPLIQNGKRNPRLTLGPIRWFLANDTDVKSASVELGLDPFEIAQAIGTFSKLRNEAIHSELSDRHEADHIRGLLLSPIGLFSKLQPFRRTDAASC